MSLVALIIAPVMTGMEFSPATILFGGHLPQTVLTVWNTSPRAVRSYYSIFAYCKHIRDLVIPRLAREACSELWPGWRCSAVPLWWDDRKAKNTSVTRNSLFVTKTVELCKLKFRGIFFSAFLESDLLVPWICWSSSKLCFSPLGWFSH